MSNVTILNQSKITGPATGRALTINQSELGDYSDYFGSTTVRVMGRSSVVGNLNRLGHDSILSIINDNPYTDSGENPGSISLGGRTFTGNNKIIPYVRIAGCNMDGTGTSFFGKFNFEAINWDGNMINLASLSRNGMLIGGASTADSETGLQVNTTAGVGGNRYFSSFLGYLSGDTIDDDSISSQLRIDTVNSAVDVRCVKKVVGETTSYYGCLGNYQNLNPGSISWWNKHVGINQIPGTETLEVNGNVKSSHNIISNTGTDWYTQYMVNGKPRYYWSIWNAETGSNVGSDLVLSGLLDDDTTPIYPFTVKRSTGYVGINNHSPTEQLEVAGNALATGDMKAYRFHNSNHTLVGYESGKNLSTAGGNNNSALTIVGYQAGYTGTTSNQYSTLVGYQAGYSINGASSCTAVGALSQYSLTNAIGNSSLGTSSLTTCTTGSYNTAIGGITLQDCTTGSSNTVIGYGAGNKTTNGTHNVYVGNNAGLNHTTSHYMTCLGCRSGEGSGSPTYCTLVGYGTDVATDATNAIVIGAGITGAPSNTVNIGNATNTNVYLKNLRQYAGGANEKGPIYWDSVTGELYYH